MSQSGYNQSTVDKLYALYQEKGFLLEDEALSVMIDDGVSLVGISRVTDRLIALGVIFDDNVAPGDEEYSDHARINYEAIYNEILDISSGQQPLIDHIRSIHPPQSREWRPLITQLNSGNEYVFNRLFDMYLRVVVRIALNYHKNNGFDLDDAIQEGSMGLMRAIRQYDASQHGAIGSYLPWWIMQYIHRADAGTGRSIRLPAHSFEAVQRLKQVLASREARTGIALSYPEIADDTQTTVEIAEEAKETPETVLSLMKAIQEPLSIEFLLENDESNEDIILTHFSVSSVDDDSLGVDLSDKLHEAMCTLKEREAQVLSLRFGLDDGIERTLEEVGSLYGVTRERIRQIESKALIKLRHPTRNKQLKGFI